MIHNLYKKYLESRSVSTDTRKIAPGSIFFALQGPNFNANTFAAEALEKGASYAVIDEEKYAKNDRYIVVDNTLEALQQLANHHRKQLSIPIIGLTGSNGKTTTKELVAAVLSTKFNVLATTGNLNNHIGVPLTLLSIGPEHEMAIIEMGANHQGEIALLSSIAEPSHGFITNIGKAHLEGFGGIEGVKKGKSELYKFLVQSGGVVWINSKNPTLMSMAHWFDAPLLYPQHNDFYHCELVSEHPTLTIHTEYGATISTHLIGAYNFENIAVALCIGKYFQVPHENAEAAISAYNPTNNRSQIIERGSTTIILDAYNANPTSMQSALNFLFSMNAENKVVILGDMKELGEDSEMEHREIGRLLAANNMNQVFLFGDEMRFASEEVTARHYTDKSILINDLSGEDFNDTVILIKGSRSMGLEKVMDIF